MKSVRALANRNMSYTHVAAEEDLVILGIGNDRNDDSVRSWVGEVMQPCTIL